MKLSTKSELQAHQVLDVLKTKRIVAIHTRGAIDRIIECVKFPETIGWKHNGKPFTKKTAYKNQQYDPIRCWLVRNRYLEQSHDGYRYHYKVFI